MRVIVAGGGTGGHAFPALAIVEELQRRDPHLELWYVGKRGNIEERLAGARGIPFRAIAAGGLARRGGWRNLWPLLMLGVGLGQSVLLMLRFRPQVVIGTGGYVSVPPVLAAVLFRIPTLIQEQNCVPGRATQLLARWATVVAATFTESIAYLPAKDVRVVGNPVRGELHPDALADRDAATARQEFDLHPDRLTVLVMGGSQGARALTNAALDMLSALSANTVQVLLMTGKDDADAARDRVAKAGVRCEVRAFIDDMASAYAAADLVVCRAGASTLAEVSGAGLPAVLVPYPYAMGDHQQKNAEALSKIGAAILLPEAALDGPTLAACLQELLDDPVQRRDMATASRQWAMPGAAEAIADVVCDLAIPGKATA